MLNTDKTTVGAATPVDTAPGASDTVVAAGAGLKFNKVSVDGTLEGAAAGANNQRLAGNSLLATLGMTYNF